MEISNLSSWFWPALSFLLASLWLWTLRRRRAAAAAAGGSDSTTACT